MATKADLQAALEVIADSLRTEARDRGWCPDYDDFVDRVNTAAGMDVLRPCGEGTSVETMWTEGSVTIEFSYRAEIPEATENESITRSMVRDAVQDMFYEQVICSNRHPLGYAADRISCVVIREARDRETQER